MANIALLPPDVADQIAAGEVVERPASVVKELVENALDAGARSITVTIDGGGIARLSVADDGAGMDPEDLALAVVRHATSKIRSADDLVGVRTYGFRGEALPSIGSVSRLRIVSRPATRDVAAEITVTAASASPVREAGSAPGTTITVEDLFYNTPARKKFLRAPGTESAACVEAVVRMAIPRPDVRFVVRRDGKVVRELLRHADVAARVRDVWPDESLAELSGERHGIRVQAMLGAPERARGGAGHIALYVNGRHVRDRLLLRAVAQSYGSTLESGRYPVGAVLVEVPPVEVDVNVHPQKSEVRFAQSSRVFETVCSLIRERLAGAPWARAQTTGHVAVDAWNARFRGGPTVAEPSAPSLLFGPRGEAALPSVDPARPTVDATSILSVPHTTHENSVPRAGTDSDPWGLSGATTSQSAREGHATDPLPRTDYLSRAAMPVGETPAALAVRDGPGPFGQLRFVAQLRRMFLVCEGPDGMVLLDQHAAAERVTFDRLRRGYASRTLAMQALLVPEIVDVGPEGVALVDAEAEELLRMGVELSVAGPTTVAVRAVPVILSRKDPARLARDVLSEAGRQSNEFSRARDLVLATIACHGSVRAGDDVSAAEAQSLLQSLDAVDFAGHCPHGRPVVWTVRWSELERKLGR